jgi:hypothetical protein
LQFSAPLRLCEKLLLPVLWPSLRSLATLRLGVNAVAVDCMLKMNLAAATCA